VLDHLPAGLMELEITDNSLVSLAADSLPRGLKVLKANNNVLNEISGTLPNSLEIITLADNRLTRPPPMPGRLKVLNLSNNQIDSMPDGLPDTIQALDLSQNLLQNIPAGSLPSRLKRLELSENMNLASLPALPQGLEILFVESTGLGELPGNLPRGLSELHASDLALTRLPNDLPTSLVTLFVTDNELSELPGSITQLTRCNIYLEGNPIAIENIPDRLPGNPGPRFHIALESDDAPRDYSATITQAVQYWLDEQDSPAMQRWHAIAKARAGASGDSAAMEHLSRFLDRLSGTIYCASEEFCAGIQEWLDVLSRPERASLLEDTLQACTGATERCDDRIGLMLDELRTLRLHDDIRIGLYGNRPADVVAALRQTFCVNRLREIAYRKIASMGTVDDVEVYLAYTVELREALGLTDVVPAMMFLDFSGVTRNDLDAALEEVRAAERTDFYKSLVVDDTWRTFLKQELGARFEQVRNRLEESMGDPLQERIDAELALRGIAVTDTDAHRGIGLAISRDMQYEALEPLTRAYLESAGVPVPEGATDASAT
jgi:hypothetical protein